METTAERLKKSPLFKGIPREKLAEIAREAEVRIVPEHQLVFQEGDAGDRVYLIQSGEVRLFKKNGKGLEIPLVELGPGAYFGQVAVLTGDVRWVNVETKTETCLTAFSKGQMEVILKEYPHVRLNFANLISKGVPGEDSGHKSKAEGVGSGSTASWLDFFALFVLSLIGGILFNYANPNGIHLFPSLLATEVITSVAPSRAIADQLSEGTLFVDARPSTFYEKAHIAGAINIPLALFDIMYMMELSEIDKNKDIIVYGRTLSSYYDEQVARKLVLRGHDNTTILKGGLSVWKKKGYPVKP